MRRYSMILVLLVVPLAACGGSEPSSGGGVAGGGETQAETGVEQPDGGLDVGECVGAASALSSAVSAASQAISGTATDLAESVQTLDTFAESAPDEIADDLKTVAAGYAAVVEAVEDADFDAAAGETPSAEDQAAIQEASNVLVEAEFTEAFQRVQTWFREECSAA